MATKVLPWIALMCLGTLVHTDNSSNGARNTTICSFEHDDCGWTKDTQGSIYSDYWTRVTASTGHASNKDNTFGTGFGHYIWLNPENERVSSTHTRLPKIVSPVFKPAHKYCIQFNYILSGSNAQPMKVYAKEYGGLGYPIKVIQPGSGRQWKFIQMELDSEYTSTNFQVVFEGTLTSYRTYYNGRYTYRNADQQIAVDDIYVTNTGCTSLPKCPTDSKVTTNGNIVTCLKFNSNLTTWSNAVQSCREFSRFGHLVSIESENKQKEVVEFIKSHSESQVAAENGGVWTSGVDIDVEGHWVWSNTQQSVNYTDWKAGQPNNVGGRQDCLVLDYPTQDYSWGDEYCDLLKPSICQITFDQSLVPGVIG